MSGRHFIYTHTSPSGKVYVGQTINIKRRWGYNGVHYKNKKKDGSYIQASFARAIDKYGWDNFKHEIILEGISKSEADYAEKYLIRWYKLHGISYNITDGGGGTCGYHYVMSKERVEAIRQRMNTNHPMKGRHHSKESRKRMSNARKGKKLTNIHSSHISQSLKGKILSERHKEKLSIYMKNHPERWAKGNEGKTVYQYDLHGNYIKSFPSAFEAAIQVSGKNNAGCIRSCIYGETNSALGYFWSYDKKDHIVLPSFNNKRTNCPKRVNQYSLEGVYLNTFESIAEASRMTGVVGRNIGRCCDPNYRLKKAGSYLWEYDYTENRKNKDSLQKA